MDFFGQQRDARRQSQWLLAGFVASLLAIGAMLHGVGMVLVWLIAPDDSSTVYLPVQAFLGILWLTMLFGSFFRWLDVRAGGAMLARRFGAVQASDRSRHSDEKLLLNIVAEIGIAAASAPPDVFVMRREHNINAFVLGSTDGRNALVVTQGALDRLDREELQALVAHEFGHIAQGDIPINMRLMIALGGLLALDEVGRLLVGRNPDELAHPGVLVGYGLRGLGSAGALFAGLLRAAFSRQREYLADAAGVQYTRNPLAMASLLAKIRDGRRALQNNLNEDRNDYPIDDDEDDIDADAIHDRHVDEIAHLCFHVGRAARWHRRLFSSHPPLQKRIDAIEPHFDVKYRKRLKAMRERDTPREASIGSRPTMPVLDSVTFGDPDAIGPVSDRIALLVSDSASALATLFALFADKAPSQRRAYLDAIAFAYDQDFADRVASLLESLPQELEQDRHLLLEHACGFLRNGVQADNRPATATQSRTPADGGRTLRPRSLRHPAACPSTSGCGVSGARTNGRRWTQCRGATRKDLRYDGWRVRAAAVVDGGGLGIAGRCAGESLSRCAQVLYPGELAATQRQ